MLSEEDCGFGKKIQHFLQNLVIFMCYLPL